ncbi:MAG: hypothetical protein KDA78_08325 [Planctomycetaceae bacterium]|nr:hypothetical protein [Planctomycetaceae bacterium]
MSEVVNACSQGKAFLEQSVNAEGISPENIQSRLVLARQWLEKATAPVLTGFSNTSWEAMAACVDFASRNQMGLTTIHGCEAILSQQRYGDRTCTLGEIRHRCDLLIQLEVDLFATWPRFGERIWNCGGRFISEDTPRRVVALESSDATSAAQHVERIRLSDQELSLQIAQWHACWNEREGGKQLAENLPEAVRHLFVEQIPNAQYPVLVHGSLSRDENQRLTALLAEINKTSRLFRLTVAPDTVTDCAHEVILAMTGFPDAVRFSEDAIEHDPLRYSWQSLLERQEPDLVLAVGPIQPDAFQLAFEKIPSLKVIHLDFQSMEQHNPPASEEQYLRIPISRPGISSGDTLVRGDGVPVFARPCLNSTLPTLSSVLEQFSK